MKEGSTAIFSPEEKKMTDKLFGYPSDYEKKSRKILDLALDKVPYYREYWSKYDIGKEKPGIDRKAACACE